MGLSELVHGRIETLLGEARQAADSSTNGLLDRTDCLDLIARLAAGMEELLSSAEGLQVAYQRNGRLGHHDCLGSLSISSTATGRDGRNPIFGAAIAGPVTGVRQESH